MTDPAEGERFLARLRRREEAAFTELVRAHEARVFGLALRLLGNRAEAEDLAQEVFLAAFRAIDAFRGESRLSTWLYRITTNLATNRIKQLARRQGRAHRPFEEGVDGAATQATPEAILAGEETARTLAAALAELDEDQRTVLVLRDLEQLSYEEIRDATGLPEGTVKSRLHRARQAVHARLAAGAVTKKESR